MKKVVCVLLVVSVVVMNIRFISNLQSKENADCSDNMLGGNPQRTNSYQGCGFDKPRLAPEIVFKDFGKGFDFFPGGNGLN